jgi:hypothetical protein
MPKYQTDQVMPIDGEHVERIPIGVKKDYWVTASGEHIYDPSPEQKKECWEGL